MFFSKKNFFLIILLIFVTADKQLEGAATKIAKRYESSLSPQREISEENEYFPVAAVGMPKGIKARSTLVTSISEAPYKKNFRRSTSLIEKSIPDVIKKFDPNQLREMAEAQSYGYKFANLDALQAVTSSFNYNNHAKNYLRVAVPGFIGIRSWTIIKILQEKGNFDIAQEWKNVIQTLTNEEKAEILSSKKLSEKFKAFRKNFETNLEAAFARIFNTIASQSFADSLGMTKLDDFLVSAAKTNAKLMVRSTGKEDSREFANAGGNESIPNVSPHPAALLKAMEKVVRSYFGEKSLAQRVGLGDKSALDEIVFAPVLIQKMIGERDAAHIPICGVMFTEEPAGGIGHRHPQDSTDPMPTTKITVINAAFGHNEGVVNSLIGVDTYIAAPSTAGAYVFYPVVRPKRERMIPVEGSSTLQCVPNPPELILQPALDKTALTTLKALADALEAFYGYSVDVEFVIEDNALYIVQARPIVYRQRTQEPSYLTNEPSADAENIFRGSTVVANDSAVLRLEDPTHVIIAPTINQALSTYLDHDHRDDVKAIISGTDAPQTSHEATTFRSEGKTVIFISRWEDVKKQFIENTNLIISPQQHVCAIIQQGTDIAISTGWSAYPLPRVLSFLPEYFRSTPLKSSDPILESAQDPASDNKEVSLKKLISDMKTSPAQQIATATRNCLRKIASSFDSKKTLIQADANLTQRTSRAREAARLLCREILSHANIERSNPLYVTRLLPIHFFEAFAFQQYSFTEFLHPESLATLTKILKDEKNIVDTGLPAYGSELAKKLHPQIAKGANLAFDQQTQETWTQFTRALAETQDDGILIGVFGDLIKELHQLNILHLWMHSTFANDAEKLFKAGNQPDPMLLKRFILSWRSPLKIDSNFLSSINSLGNRINDFDPSSFGKKESFAKAWENFQTKILEKIVSPQFSETFKKAKNLSQTSACQMLTKAVTLFDVNIKAMKGSSAFTPEEKLVHFKTMLEKYFGLLRCIVHLVPAEQVALQSSIAIYFQYITNVFNKNAWLTSDLESSKDFDAQPFTLGSKADLEKIVQYEARPPQSGEDIFTVIHQSLLVCTARMLVNASGNSIKKPWAIEALEGVLAWAFEIEKVPFTGFEISQGTYMFTYNIALRNHSCAVSMLYKKASHDTTLSLTFLGANENHRWDYIATQALLLESMPNCGHVKNFKVSHNIAHVEIVLRQEEIEADLTPLANGLQFMKNFTFNMNDFERNLYMSDGFPTHGETGLRKSLNKSKAKQGTDFVQSLFCNTVEITRDSLFSENSTATLSAETPPAMITLDGILQSVFDEGITLSNTTATGESITVTYECPLQDSSCAITLHHEKSSSDTTVSLAFTGNNDRNRWDYIVTQALLLESMQGGGKIKNLSLTENAAHIDILIRQDELMSNPESLSESMTKILYLTCDTTTSFYLSNEFPLNGENGLRDSFAKIKGKVPTTLVEFLFCSEAILVDQLKDESLKSVSETLASSDLSDGIWRRGLKIYAALAKNNLAISQAIEAAKAKWREFSSESYDIFKALVRRGNGIDDGFEIAIQGFSSNQNAEKLLNFIVQSGYKYPEAINIATQGILSPDKKIREKALALFESLFDQKQGFHAAEELITSHRNSLTNDLENLGEKLKTAQKKK